MHALAGVLCVALFVATSCHAAIPGLEDCSTPSSRGKFIDGEITPCTTDPCALVKGRNTSITLKFISTDLVTAGRIVVHGIIAGIPVPFSLPDDNLCHFIQPGCTIQPNSTEQMDYSLYVKESYPSIQLAIKWQLVNELGVDLVCIKFPAKLASTPPSESWTAPHVSPPETLIGHLRRILGKLLPFGSRD
ncbi:Niemann Pick C2 protein [Echinococcus multilocularis]|uniref:Niemann Pick C2 protein n=1 Tax=Echinococcus multilocularis TaxID=6211 RepID=A0A068Y3I0_ECHMU|nr:Niemann Pick C2 protein [Echinococcus multilocularis]